MSARNPGPSGLGTNGKQNMNERKRGGGGQGKPSMCRKCHEVFPSAEVFRLHSVYDCLKNKQKMKQELEGSISREDCKNQNLLNIDKINLIEQLNSDKQDKEINGANEEKLKKKKRRKNKPFEESDFEINLEEKNSDLDSPIAKKRNINVENKTNDALLVSKEDALIKEAEVSQQSNSSVIITLGELINEANKDGNLEVPKIVVEASKDVKEKDKRDTIENLKNEAAQKRKRQKREKRREWEKKRELKRRDLNVSRTNSDTEIFVNEKVKERNNSGQMGQLNKAREGGRFRKRKTSIPKDNRIYCNDLKLKIQKMDDKDRNESDHSVLDSLENKATTSETRKEDGGKIKKSLELISVDETFIKTTKTLKNKSFIPKSTEATANLPIKNVFESQEKDAPNSGETGFIKTMSLADQLRLTDESDKDKNHNNEDGNKFVDVEKCSPKAVLSDFIPTCQEKHVVIEKNNCQVSFSDQKQKRSKVTDSPLNSVILGSPKKSCIDDALESNSPKDSNKDLIMDDEEEYDLLKDMSYDGLKFSDEDDEFGNVDEGGQATGHPVNLPIGNHLSPSSSRKTASPSPARSPSSPSSLSSTVNPSQTHTNETRKNLEMNGTRKKTFAQVKQDRLLEREDQMLPIKTKTDRENPKSTPGTSDLRTNAAVDIEDEDDDAIQLDVSYTFLDEEEEAFEEEKDYKEGCNKIFEKTVVKAKIEERESTKTSKTKIKFVLKQERDNLVDDLVSQELTNKNKDDDQKLTREQKVTERRRKFEMDHMQDQLQRKGNHCLSLVKGVECNTSGCSWVHVLDPQAALEVFHQLYHQCEQEDRARRLLSFWKFNAQKSVPVGGMILSGLAEMASKQKLEIDARDFGTIVDFVQSFPDFYTMSKEAGRLVMVQLLEGFTIAVETEPHRGSKKDVEIFFTFAWNRIYLSSLRHGLVMQQNVLENICRLGEMVGRRCQLCELVFLSSLAPTTWVPLHLVTSLFSRISVPSGNVFSCEYSAKEHTRDACLHLAKTLSRLMYSEWATLNRQVDNFDRKLQFLVNAIRGESIENITRFYNRVRDMGLNVFLPKLGAKSERIKDKLVCQVEAGKWRDVAREMVNMEKVDVEDMVELVEELYGVMSHLAPHVATAGIEILLKELEVLHCSHVHRQLFCQLGLSLLIKFVAENDFVVGSRVVQAMVRTGVDLTTLKPFTVFELAGLDDNFSPVAVPLMLIDVYICSGYTDLALNLLAQWDYLQSYPRPIGDRDQHLKTLTFEKLLDKASVRCAEIALPICIRIFEILCSGNVEEWLLAKRNKMTEMGRTMLVEMLNRNLKGGELWAVVKGIKRSLYVVTGEVARGVLVRLVQAGMMQQAAKLYKWTELAATGTYSKQETRIEVLKLHLKSYYSLEEIQIIITEFFNELKKTPYIGEKDVFIIMSETELPPSGVLLHKRVGASKQEALDRVYWVLGSLRPPMSASVGGVPFIPGFQVYNHVSQSA